MRFFPTLPEELTSPLPPAELLRRLQAGGRQARPRLIKLPQLVPALHKPGSQPIA